MEKVNFLRKNIVSAMTEYADYFSGSNLPKVDYSLITDKSHDKYQLLAVGWEKNERIYSVIFHADIVGEYIWIQEDNTEDGFANLLLEKGVDKKDIVLAYYPEYHRGVCSCLIGWIPGLFPLACAKILPRAHYSR